MRDLNDMALFVAVADHRGFAAAGRALNIPKSRLSRRLAQLEDELGVRLIQRSTRQFAVTEIGRQFLAHCRAMLSEARAAEEVIASQRAEPRGIVRISCPVEIAQNLVAACLPDFLATYPRVRVQLLVSNRRYDLFNENIDLALRVRPAPEMDTELVTRALGHTEKLLVASKAYLDTHGRPQQPQDIAAHRTLSLVDGEIQQTWNFFPRQGAAEPTRVEVEPSLLCGEFSVLLQAALAGQGITGLPETVCGAAVLDGRLEPVLPHWRATAGVLHLAYLSRRGLLPAVRALVDFLCERLPPLLEAMRAESGCLSPGALAMARKLELEAGIRDGRIRDSATADPAATIPGSQISNAGSPAA